MSSIHIRDDLNNFKKIQQTQSLLKAEKLKEKLGKQDFHYDMEEVSEPVTATQAEATQNQKQNRIQNQQHAEMQIQALRDSTQTTTQAIEN